MCQWHNKDKSIKLTLHYHWAFAGKKDSMSSRLIVTEQVCLFVVLPSCSRFLWSTLSSFCTVQFFLSYAMFTINLGNMERINFQQKQIFGNAKNRTQCRWERSGNANTRLFRPLVLSCLTIFAWQEYFCLASCGPGFYSWRSQIF